jgi:hypothetical protein
MKLWTVTNDYVEVIIDGKLVKVTLEYSSNKQVFTIAGSTYFINQLS